MCLDAPSSVCSAQAQDRPTSASAASDVGGTAICSSGSHGTRLRSHRRKESIQDPDEVSRICPPGVKPRPVLAYLADRPRAQPERLGSIPAMEPKMDSPDGRNPRKRANAYGGSLVT